MKILAIADGFIPADYILEGFEGHPELSDELEVRTWAHESIEALQADNLAVEQGGPEAVEVPTELFEGVEDVEVIVTQFCPVPRSILERAVRLRAVGVMRGGTENVDVDAAAERGVKVLNTPGRNAEAVAEFTLGLMLTEMRNISRSEARLRNGSWDRDFPDAAAIPEIEGKTVGVIGYGQIGRRVSRFVRAMGASVLVYDPWATDVEDGVELVGDLLDLASRSDIVTIHARLTAETHHLVSREVLAAMRPGAFLINSARSGLVDEQALLEALRSRSIMGAAIDTFDHEPLPLDSGFQDLENVTITGHLAGSTVDAFKKTPSLLADRIVREVAGR